MKTLLSILLLAFTVGAQEADIVKHAPQAAGRGGTQAAGAPAGQTVGRGRGTAPSSSGVALSPKDLKYPPLRTLQTPNAVTFTLTNGMKVYLLESHDLPVINGIAVVRTGSLLDPPKQVGLAQLAGITLRTGGTTLKTGEQIDSLLDDVAASVDSSIGDSFGTLSFAGLKENVPSTLQLFKEMLTQPGFRQAKIDLAKARLRANISHRNDNAETTAHREFAGLIYGKFEPYGWQQEYATLDRISRNDLRMFHQRYFFPSNVMLGIWGDFKTAEMKTALEQLFADWTVRQPAVPEFPKVKTKPWPGVFLAEKKDAPQTFLSLGHLGGQRNDKDCPALEVTAFVLGAGRQGRISDHLRNKLGIASDVHATWNAGYAQQGVFEISGSVQSLSTVAAIKAIQEEIDRIRTAEITEDEWRNARDAAVNNLVFTNDNQIRLLGRELLLDYYGYPKDYLAQYQKALQSVTRADVLRVAKQYLNPANLTVVVAANPTMFGEPLDKLGTVTRLDITIPEAKPEVVESTNASLAEGKQILLKAQAAAGGTEKLAAVKDYTMLAEYQIDPAVPSLGGSRIIQTDKWVSPTAFRQEANISVGRVTVYADGKIGWVSVGQGWGALTGAQRSQVFGDLFRVYYRLLLSDRLEGREVNAINDSSVQIADSTGQVTNVEFDAETHLLRRVSYDTQQPGGTPVYSEEIYDDFRDIGGVKVPFKVTVNQGGRKFSEGVVKDYKINTGLKPLELARRPQ